MTNTSSSLSSSSAALSCPHGSSNALPNAGWSPSSSSSGAALAQDDFAHDYRDIGNLISQLRSRNDTTLYQKTISLLRQKVQEACESPAPLPKAVKLKDGSFNLIRMAPDVETIILPGGGAKGISYVGLMRDLHAAFPKAKEFIGSSAGSLAATFMSFESSSDNMQDLLANELPKLLKTQPEMREIYPSLKFQNTMSIFSRALWRITGGKPLGEANGFVHKLDEVTSKAAIDYLRNYSRQELQGRIKEYCQIKHLPDTASGPLLDRLDHLGNPADFTRNREGSMITFSDLDVLHFLNPVQFKDIQTTGFDSVSKTIKYFNATETPDIPVAYAARLSMSHPLLAKGVRLEQQTALSEAIFIDGGVASNIPSEAVYNHDVARAQGDSASLPDEILRAKTVVMKFDENHTAHPAILKTNRIKIFFSSITKKIKDWFMRMVSHNPNGSRDSKNDKEKFNAAGPNGYVLYHGDLRTTDMNVSPERQERAIYEASIGILAQVLQRKGQGYFVKVDSLQEAAARLTEEEKDQIQKAGRPTRKTFACDKAEQELELRKSALKNLGEDSRTTEDEYTEAQTLLTKAQTYFMKQQEEFRNATLLYNLVADGKDAIDLDTFVLSPLTITPSSPIYNVENEGAGSAQARESDDKNPLSSSSIPSTPSFNLQHGFPHEQP